jgi:hypothetical protein
MTGKSSVAPSWLARVDFPEPLEPMMTMRFISLVVANVVWETAVFPFGENVGVDQIAASLIVDLLIFFVN